MDVIRTEGGVTAPKGFQAAAAAAGIKYQGRNDMAMIYSEKPCQAAGVFTTNVVKAAPVRWDRHVVDTAASVQAVVINSGIANACTGAEGYACCEKTARAAAQHLHIPADGVLVASTGVIGAQIPVEKLERGVALLAAELSGDQDHGTAAAQAIMTTDTRKKETAVTVRIGGTDVTVGGMCKGSGMIHPNMATMLCFVTTDASISHKMLQKALCDDVQDTFNMISVDGDTSTNDSVLLLANGMAGNPVITEENPSYRLFCAALHQVMTELSQMIAGDGEGCTCLFEVTAVGCSTKAQARKLAKSVVTSSLTKAAIFGHDANWGRILCAMGYSGADFDPEQVDLYFESRAGRLKIVENGVSTGYSEETATKILSEEKVTCTMDVKMGTETATAWGCDLTFDYVKINADYRS